MGKPYGYIVHGYCYDELKTAKATAWALSMTAGNSLPIIEVYLKDSATETEKKFANQIEELVIFSSRRFHGEPPYVGCEGVALALTQDYAEHQQLIDKIAELQELNQLETDVSQIELGKISHQERREHFEEIDRKRDAVWAFFNDVLKGYDSKEIVPLEKRLDRLHSLI